MGGRLPVPGREGGSEDAKVGVAVAVVLLEGEEVCGEAGACELSLAQHEQSTREKWFGSKEAIKM